MPYFEFGKPVEGLKIDAGEIRDLFEALAVNNATSQNDKPQNPRNGMTRFYNPEVGILYYQVYWDGAWINLIQVATTADQALHKEQSFVGLATWTWSHNLGRKPVIACLDANDKQIVPSEIEHSDANTVVVQHASAQSGSIIAVG